jgi:hypothetical protein
MSTDQISVKIVHEILKYDQHDVQVKLSLLQDLIISLLPKARESAELTTSLQGCRSRCNSEDVVRWVDALLSEYIGSSQVAPILASLKSEQLAHTY